MLKLSLKIFGWTLIAISTVFYLQQLPENINIAKSTEGMSILAVLIGGFYLFIQGVAVGLLCLWASRRES